MLLHPRAVGSKLKLVGGSTAPGREGAGGCQVRAPSCAAKGVAVWRALVAASDNLPRRFRCPGCSRTWLSWRQPGPVECFWLWDLGFVLVMPECLGAYGKWSSGGPRRSEHAAGREVLPFGEAGAAQRKPAPPLLSLRQLSAACSWLSGQAGLHGAEAPGHGCRPGECHPGPGTEGFESIVRRLALK